MLFNATFNNISVISWRQYTYKTTIQTKNKYTGSRICIKDKYTGSRICIKDDIKN